MSWASTPELSKPLEASGLPSAGRIDPGQLGDSVGDFGDGDLAVDHCGGGAEESVRRNECGKFEKGRCRRIQGAMNVVVEMGYTVSHLGIGKGKGIC